jgi:hypothetical protein
MKKTVSQSTEGSVIMEAGNECSLGGDVIIVVAFRTANYGETDVSAWGFKPSGAGAEGQNSKLTLRASLSRRK